MADITHEQAHMLAQEAMAGHLIAVSHAGDSLFDQAYKNALTEQMNQQDRKIQAATGMIAEAQRQRAAIEALLTALTQ